MLLPRVRENAKVLPAGYRSIAETVLAKHEITPAAGDGPWPIALNGRVVDRVAHRWRRTS